MASGESTVLESEYSDTTIIESMEPLGAPDHDEGELRVLSLSEIAGLFATSSVVELNMPTTYVPPKSAVPQFVRFESVPNLGRFGGRAIFRI